MEVRKQTTLTIPPAVRRQLSAWVRDEYPREACGLLLGRGTEVVEARRGRNVADGGRRDRYVLAPEDFTAAWREADALGLEILGIWHSHPDRPAEPSPADRQDAWNGYAYLILGVRADRMTEIRSWRLADGAFEEEELTT